MKQQVTAATEVGEVAGAQEAEHVAQASEACRRAAHAAQDACEVRGAGGGAGSRMGGGDKMGLGLRDVEGVEGWGWG